MKKNIMIKILGICFMIAATVIYLASGRDIQTGTIIVFMIGLSLTHNKGEKNEVD